jgi:hypothetical protein
MLFRPLRQAKDKKPFDLLLPEGTLRGATLAAAECLKDHQIAKRATTAKRLFLAGTIEDLAVLDDLELPVAPAWDLMAKPASLPALVKQLRRPEPAPTKAKPTATRARTAQAEAPSSHRNVQQRPALGELQLVFVAWTPAALARKASGCPAGSSGCSGPLPRPSQNGAPGGRGDRQRGAEPCAPDLDARSPALPWHFSVPASGGRAQDAQAAAWGDFLRDLARCGDLLDLDVSQVGVWTVDDEDLENVKTCLRWQLRGEARQALERSADRSTRHLSGYLASREREQVDYVTARLLVADVLAARAEGQGDPAAERRALRLLEAATGRELFEPALAEALSSPSAPVRLVRLVQAEYARAFLEMAPFAVPTQSGGADAASNKKDARKNAQTDVLLKIGDQVLKAYRELQR